MSSNETPVTEKIVPYKEIAAVCPICSKRAKHPLLKSKLFAERDRDVYLRPMTYLWEMKNVETCHPPLYFMWSCPDCRFTCAHLDFSDACAQLHVSQTSLCQSLADAATRPEYQAMLSLLSSNTHELPRTTIAGLKLHFLAVYQLGCIAEIAEKETLALGKYYLRLAWLFKDIQKIQGKEAEAIRALLRTISALWTAGTFNEVDALRRAVMLLEKGLETSSSIASTRDEIELLLLVSRIYMGLGEIRKARNLGVYTREKIIKFEEELEFARSQGGVGDSEIGHLKYMQGEVLNIMMED